MSKVTILLASATKGSKADAAMETLANGLKERGIDAEIILHNLYESEDLSPYKDTCDLAVKIGTGGLDVDLPLVQGLGLLYGYLGTDDMFNAIEKIVQEKGLGA